MKKHTNEPARIKFFWTPIYKVVLKSVKEILADLFESCSDFVTSHSGWLWILVIPFLILMYPVLALISAVVVALSTGITLINYMLGGIVIISDIFFTKIKHIGVHCSRCQAKISLPYYACTCGAIHKRLAPGKYGIFKRTCSCGKKIGTTFISGRESLPGKWVCPECNYSLDGGSYQIPTLIPIVGGPSSGKTCYISMAIAQIEQNAASKYNLDFAYVENTSLNDDYQDNKALMQSGRLPDKTADTRMKYYQFSLTPKRNTSKNMIYICDVAGEVYKDDQSGIKEQMGYRHANAFLMVIDPLSIEEYRTSIEGQINLSKYGASKLNLDVIIDNLLIQLKSFKNCKHSGLINNNVVVLISKCDIPGLDEKIGEKAVSEYMANNPNATLYSAKNQLCENFLLEYGEANFVNMLHQFKSIQFFTCTSLGHVQDGNAFAPKGVEEPLLWLIDKAYDNLKLNEMLANKA